MHFPLFSGTQGWPPAHPFITVPNVTTQPLWPDWTNCYRHCLLFAVETRPSTRTAPVQYTRDVSVSVQVWLLHAAGWLDSHKRNQLSDRVSVTAAVLSLARRRCWLQLIKPFSCLKDRQWHCKVCLQNKARVNPLTSIVAIWVQP